MNFKELVEKTRTVHHFQENQVVEEKLILESLALSLNAPNHKFTFPWRYYWPSSTTREKIVQFFATAKGQGEPAREEAAYQIYKAPSEILFFAQKLASDEFTQKEDYASLSIAVQIFAMNLREHGVFYKWSTTGLIQKEKLYELLKIDATKEKIVGMLLVGFPKNEVGLKRRPTLEEVLVRN